MIDVNVFVAVLSFVVVFVWRIASPAECAKFLDRRYGVVPYYFLGFVLAPFAMALDAATLALFGNTPGKALLGIWVARHDGERLNYGTALRRNLGVYCQGMIFCLPIVVLLANLYAFGTANAGKPSAWDAATESRVYGSPKWYRTLFGAVCWFVMLSSFGAMAESVARQQ